MPSLRETYDLYNLIGISRTIKVNPSTTNTVEAKDILKHELMHQAAPKLADGRNYFVKYIEWQGSEMDLSLIVNNSQLINPYWSTVELTCFHAWLICLLMGTKEANSGEYVILHAHIADKTSVFECPTDGSLFDRCGVMHDGSVWKKR